MNHWPNNRWKNIAYALVGGGVLMTSACNYKGTPQPDASQNIQVSESNQVAPQAGQTPLTLDLNSKTDAINYLMGAAGERQGSFEVQSYGQPKHAWLQGFDEDDDVVSWEVSSNERGANFRVTMLARTFSPNQTFELRVDNNEPISFSLENDIWHKEYVGDIFIPKGTHKITLRRTSFDGDVQLKSLELIESNSYDDYLARVDSFRSDASKLTNADYGLMFQYGAWGHPISGTAKDIEGQTNDFDVNAFLDTVKSTGAKYVIWSTTWWTYEFNAPISSVDKILGHGNRTSERDLIGDLATALDKEGIDFYLYYHTGQDSHLGYETTDWWKLQNWPSEFLSTGLGDKSEFEQNWRQVISEIGTRYGTLLDGWFFDDGLVYYPGSFEALGAAAKAGNPDRLISYNPWLVSNYTDFQEISFGEECKAHDADIGGDGKYVRGGERGLYGHCMHRMEDDWGIRAQDQVIGAPNYTVQSAYDMVIENSSRNVPTSFNLLMYEDGTMAQDSLNVLIGMKAKLEEASPK